MRILNLKTADVPSDSDSDDDVVALPVNKNFRCLKKDEKPAESSNDADFFLLDTVGGEDVDEEEEAEEEKEDGEKRKRFLRKNLTQETDAAIEMTAEEKKRLNTVLSKSVIQPGFESSLGSSASLKGVRALKRAAKEERAKTTGNNWFDMPATELTDERRADLEMLAMRATLDPTRHYRKNDKNVIPKYFQVGRVVDDHRDFYGGRLTKKERKRTLVEEIMVTDKEAIHKNTMRYQEHQQREKSKIRGSFQKPRSASKNKDTVGKKKRK